MKPHSIIPANITHIWYGKVCVYKYTLSTCICRSIVPTLWVTYMYLYSKEHLHLIHVHVGVSCKQLWFHGWRNWPSLLAALWLATVSNVFVPTHTFTRSYHTRTECVWGCAQMMTASIKDLDKNCIIMQAFRQFLYHVIVNNRLVCTYW